MNINMKDIQFRFMQASGPGGQHVNKVATAVQLKYNIEQADLPDFVKHRLHQLAGNQINQDGCLIIEAKRHRSQHKNKQDALHRLQMLIEKARQRPKKRIPTKPARKAVENRLEKKQLHSRKKQSRRKTNLPTD